ncbi:MAG: translation initiation factor 1 [Bacteriovoracaceae bacterium]|jgi:translation initiation factor 1
MNDDTRLVWSDEEGDLRKKPKKTVDNEVDEAGLEILVRRMTSGKGRTIIELTGLPNNKSWCKKLAKDIKKSLGVGGAYKNDFIEVHGEKIEEVLQLLEQKKLKYKKTGG